MAFFMDKKQKYTKFDKKAAKAARRSEPVREENEASDSVVSGRNAVKELFESGRSVDKVYISRGEREGSIKLLIGIASERKIPIVELDKERLDSMCRGSRHQGIVAIAAERDYASLDDIFALAEERGEKPLIVVLDGVEDPHNLGAIIRNAECAGAHGVIIRKARSVGITPTVVKASAGAIEHMLVAKVTNIAAALDELKERGVWVYAADMGGAPCYETDMTSSAAVVLGSEGFGISRLVKEKCDFTVSIPLYGSVNSLNVSAASAVILSEAARQRHNGGAKIGQP